MKDIALEDYRALAAFRSWIRGYVKFSNQLVSNAKLEPGQYQVLLAVKGLAPGVRPRIAEIARQLQIKHHTAVEVVDGLEEKKLISRERRAEDRREVLVRLTPAGEQVISALVIAHLSEVFSRGPLLLHSLQRLLAVRERHSESPGK